METATKKNSSITWSLENLLWKIVDCSEQILNTPLKRIFVQLLIQVEGV